MFLPHNFPYTIRFAYWRRIFRYPMFIFMKSHFMTCLIFTSTHSLCSNDRKCRWSVKCYLIKLHFVSSIYSRQCSHICIENHLNCFLSAKCHHSFDSVFSFFFSFISHRIRDKSRWARKYLKLMDFGFWKKNVD